MTTISPLRSQMLANTLNMQNNNHPERIYQELTRHANDVKPNEPKAKLIKENPIQAAKSLVVDTVKDGKNFFVAAKTGKMNDNNLGRINDLGMKFGSAIIALFLASNAPTKTKSIMQFVGATTFFSVMSLWPKIFINLPARLVHGFRIDERYLSAQGDKKDLYLDNQFIPTDVLPKEQLRKEAQRAGINYDSELGEEKILRKRQKTALQNRTLWMATAGFSTPLLTAVIGDKVEPLVKEGVIQHGYKKSLKAMENFDDVLNSSHPIVKNQKALEEIFTKYASGLNEEGLSELSKTLNFDFADIFKDIDDQKPIKGLKFNVDVHTLESLRKQTSIVQQDNLEQLLKDAFGGLQEASANAVEANKSSGRVASILGKYAKKSETVQSNVLKVSDEKIKEIVKQFKDLKEGQTFEGLSNIIKETLGANGNTESAKQINQQIDQKLKEMKFNYNDAPFFETLKQFNNDILSSVRGKLKAYLDIFNPVAGSKDESVYTKIYRDKMKGIIKKAGFSENELKLIECVPSKTSDPASLKVLSDFFKKFAALSDEEYIREIVPFVFDGKDEKLNALLAKICDKENFEALSKEERIKCYDDIKTFIAQHNNKQLNDFMTSIVGRENIDKITALQGPANKPEFNALINGLGEKIAGNIRHFSEVANANITNIKSRALISANLERQIESKNFENALRLKGLVTKSMPIETWIEKARFLVYEGSVAADACRVELSDSSFAALKEVIFDEKNFTIEKGLLPDIENVISQMKNLGTSAKDNSTVTGMAALLRDTAKDILNNKAWKKIFIPMTIALIAITLLVQPFFGNIKNEYPENKKKGAN